MKLDEEILLYAFRYALGRQSYAVHTTVDYVLENWDNLKDRTKKLIKKEILNYRKEYGICGMEMDDKLWQEIINKE